MFDPRFAAVVNAHFQTPIGWGSGHLQTVRSRAVPLKFDLARFGSQRSVTVDLDDGSGDQIVVSMHRTFRADRVAVASPRQPVTRPLVALVHGLGGTAESDYIRSTAAGLLGSGFNVARIDLRGAGRSAPVSRLMYHAGRTEDLRTVLRHLADEPEARDTASGEPVIALMGFSLGGAATIKLIGEPLGDLPVCAGVAVSAPLDLALGAEHLQNMLFGAYDRYLLSSLRNELLRAPGDDAGPVVDERERSAIQAARSIEDFDNAVTSLRNGWRDAAEYYAVNSSSRFLATAGAPLLVVHSLDDPMIPAQPYLDIDWHELESSAPVQRAITERGGHVGFHVRGRRLPWYVGQAAAFIRSRSG